MTWRTAARLVLGVMVATGARAGAAERVGAGAVTFNTNFEGGSLGRVEVVGDGVYRCHVEGQCDERGRNRQASWYYFRMDHVKGRPITIMLTDLVGEYNDKPGAVPYGPDIVPVFSNDGGQWTHFAGTEWDKEKKEATIKFTAEADSIWIAHIAPYTPRNLGRLLAEVGKSPFAVVEVIGKTAEGRDLHLVTVTDPAVADAGKKVVWLQARQHAWEAGTSWVMEGAMRWAVSEEAAGLRGRVVFKFTPMMDPDGCAGGKVRFNANGYDVNRHWDEVNLRDKHFLNLMPEIWYVKKAVFGQVDSGKKIDLMLNLHNTETGEYLATHVKEGPVSEMMQRFFDRLVGETSFDPSRPLSTGGDPADTNSLWEEKGVPVMLMEQRIGTGKKLGHRPTVEDRVEFGGRLIRVMGEVVSSQ